MVRIPRPRRKWKENFNVNAALITHEKGYSILRPVKVESGEILKDPDKKKGEIYNGVYPTILEFDRKIFPLKSRFRFPKTFRVRLYSKLAHESFTRSLFTGKGGKIGKFLSDEKMLKVLRERNVIDADGYLLDADGKRTEVEEGYVKVDVSDMDFIKSEFHAYHQSKNNEKIADAMKKAGRNIERMIIWMFLIGIAGLVLTVFIMQGGI
jgi:hypothetical protein